MKLTLDLHLPFKLPIKDESKLVSAYYGANFSCEFKSYKRTTITEGMEEYPQEQSFTFLTITYMPVEKLHKGLDENELCRQTVLSSLDYVNRLLDAIRSKLGLDYIYNITIADLPMYVYIDDEEKEGYLYLTQPQETLRDTSKNISKEQMHETIKLLKTWEDHPEIFLVEKFYDSAKSHLYKEQFIDTIIELQTSFEVFIRNTHKLILLQKGHTEEEINNMPLIPFRNVIEDHIGKKYLNVDLNFKDPNKGPINQWYEDLYLLRNDIVHKGFIHITGEQAYKAYDAYVIARNFISDKLVENNYLKSNGNVDLILFKKNTKGSIEDEKLFTKLKESGLFEEDTELVVPEDKI